MDKKSEKGQALLIILLIMAVVLTIALSLISRSVTDITITQKEEEAARAYSAAEAGIERSLQSGANTNSTFATGDSFNTLTLPLAKASISFLVPLLMSSGETTPVWLVSHNSNGALVCTAQDICFTGSEVKVCWGDKDKLSNEATTPALELTIIYTTANNDLSTAKVARTVLDPYVGRPDSNNFDQGSQGPCTIDNKEMAFSKTINLSTAFPGITLRSLVDETKGPQIARLRLLYNTDRAHPVGLTITSTGSFPQQGNTIESSGTSGQSTRKVKVFQLYPDLPPVFDYGLFSGTGGITK